MVINTMEKTRDNVSQGRGALAHLVGWSGEETPEVTFKQLTGSER